MRRRIRYADNVEYLTHGISGLLYDKNDPRALDLSDAAAIGAAGRHKVERGFAQWRKDQCELVAGVLFRGREKAYALLKSISHRDSFNQQDIPNVQVSAPVMRAKAPTPQRKWRCRSTQGTAHHRRHGNSQCRRNFLPTLESILSQTYPMLKCSSSMGHRKIGRRISLRTELTR